MTPTERALLLALADRVVTLSRECGLPSASIETLIKAVDTETKSRGSFGDRFPDATRIGRVR